MLGGDGRQVNEEATWPGQVLINAVTGQVKSVKKHLSGNATYQDLALINRILARSRGASKVVVNEFHSGRRVAAEVFVPFYLSKFHQD
jgi:hypothetical protein